MQDHDYPCPGWVLQPSFKPKEVTLMGPCGYENKYIEAGNGKWYARSDVYATKTDAIRGGWAHVKRQQEALDKKQAALNKKQEVLRKAAD